MKLINKHRYINVGWHGTRGHAEEGAKIVRKDYPGFSVRLVPERGAEHTVNANRYGYSIYRSVIRLLK